jgi:hypothetical protein
MKENEYRKQTLFSAQRLAFEQGVKRPRYTLRLVNRPSLPAEEQGLQVMEGLL